MPQSQRFLEILKIPRGDYYIFGCKGSLHNITSTTA